MKYQNLIIYLSLITLILSLFIPSLNENMEASTNLFFSVATFFSIIFYLYTFKNIYKSWVRFETLFLIGYIIVHFQIPFLYSLGIQPSVPSFVWLNKQVVNYATWFSAISIHLWMIGSTFYIIKNSKKESIKNISSILRSDFYHLIKDNLKEDIDFYHKEFPQDLMYQQYELDLQLHYMRRMLNPCMNIINKKIPLHQVFTSPKTFGFMWSLNPDLRTDEVYFNLLKNYSPKLLDIPWARTGINFMEKEGQPDNYKKRHHDYGNMIRTYFINDIELTIKENKDIVDKLFNTDVVLNLINNVKKYPVENNFTIEEKLLWISCLIKFIHVNNIIIDLPEPLKLSKMDVLQENFKYKLKYFYKKNKKINEIN